MSNYNFTKTNELIVIVLQVVDNITNPTQSMKLKKADEMIEATEYQIEEESDFHDEDWLIDKQEFISYYEMYKKDLKKNSILSIKTTN